MDGIVLQVPITQVLQYIEQRGISGIEFLNGNWVADCSVNSLLGVNVESKGVVL